MDSAGYTKGQLTKAAKDFGKELNMNRLKERATYWERRFSACFHTTAMEVAKMEDELKQKNDFLDKIDEATKSIEPKIENLAFKVTVLVDEINHLREKNQLWNQSFELYDSAMRRGTKLWQGVTEHEHWPDAAKLTAWMVERIELLEKHREIQERLIDANYKYIYSLHKERMERDALEAGEADDRE